MYRQRINTKSKRLAQLEANFKFLQEKGAEREDYNNLIIWTWTDTSGNSCVKIFRGTSTKPINHNYAKDPERIKSLIQQVKRNADEINKWKEEQKEKNKGHVSAHAACAAAIRKELKEAFPGVKFQVTSDTYSGGNSVHAYWYDGPTDRMVDAIIKKYQYGHFDGMIDMYENSNDRDDIPQVKFVIGQRTMSDETNAALRTEKIFEMLGGEKDHNNRDQIRIIWWNHPIPAGAIVKGIVRTGKDGVLEDVYKLEL